MNFEYGNIEIEYLKNRNKLLGEAIEKIGHIHRSVDANLFSPTQARTCLSLVRYKKEYHP